MTFTCVKCRKEIPKDEVRFIDHDHICVSCLKPKKKKKNKSYIPPSKSRRYFSRDRSQMKECEIGCGAKVRSQEAHNATAHFCSFCKEIIRKIEEHNEMEHKCATCEELVEDPESHLQIAHAGQ